MSQGNAPARSASHSTRSGMCVGSSILISRLLSLGCVCWCDVGVSWVDSKWRQAPDLTERVRKQVEAYAEYEIRFVALKAEDAFDSKLVERLEGIARDAKVGENGGSYKTTANVFSALMLPFTDAAPTTSPSPRDELLRAMSDLPPASYPHMLSQIRDSLLATAALHLPNVSCLLSAETSTRQAQSIIGSAAIGAGWRLPLDLSAVYDIEGESYDSYAASSSTRRRITRIKPLKDVTVKEAAYYCRINRLSTVNWRRWDSFVAKGKREKAGVRSLERLTEGENACSRSWVSLTTLRRLHHRSIGDPPSDRVDHLSDRLQARVQGR